MIAKPFYIRALFLLLLSVFQIQVFAQDVPVKKDSLLFTNTDFKVFRGNNVIDIAAGTSVMNGDFVDPMFEIYFHIGYKRHLTPSLNINIGYNKFNLAYKNQFNEGFMSFDLNLEYLMLPQQRFSPFVFAGGGYNAANYFEQTATKVQFGGGIEVIVVDGLGLKLFTDYNYVFSDELDGVVAGDADDTYFRIGFGANFYFDASTKRHKVKKGQKSTLKTNPIIDKN